MKYLFSIIIVFFFTNAYSIQTDWSNGIESQVRIISPVTHNNNQTEVYFGLQYKLQDGWKTYWRSPGDGGYSQEINWGASSNIKNLEILWPTPKTFQILGVNSIGYVNEVTFPLKIIINNIEAETILFFDVNYLTCKDICIPGTAHLELVLPPGLGKITKHFYDIEKSLSLIPEKKLDIVNLESITAEAYTDDKIVSILVQASSKKIFNNPKFYLHTEFGLPVIIPQVSYSSNYKNISANFNFDKKLISNNKFNIDIILDDNNQDFEFNTNLDIKKISEIEEQKKSVLSFFIVALIGGLILNIMPCVFPVLSIKLLSVLNHLNEQTSIRKSFITTSIGIVSSFGLLALGLIFLRSIGANIGWGMQFQQPQFLMIIALILFLFIINLLGFFDFHTPTFVSNRFFLKLSNSNFSKDFFMGFFATILATPCSAPFVGTAITAAFTQTSATMLGIFIFMGLGMALPYLLISLFPSMIRILPSPGRWMNFIKYFLGLLLFATLIWIFSILLNHFNVFYILAVSLLFFVTATVIKFYKKKLLVLVITGIIFFSLPSFSFFKYYQQVQDSKWIDLNTVNINDYIQNDEVVFVDITADWCATCQFNKINVLNSSIIQEIFNKQNIVKVRGDWTKSNKNIENFLQEHNRFGIPFNVIYSKSYPNGIILSELLTNKEIIETIEKIIEN